MVCFSLILHSFSYFQKSFPRTLQTFPRPAFRTLPVPIFSRIYPSSSFHTQSKMSTKTAPGEQFEVRQTSATDDWHPDPSKSLPLSKERQALIDDIIALYSCQPTVERVKRYTPDCVYDVSRVKSLGKSPSSLTLCLGSVCVRQRPVCDVRRQQITLLFRFWSN
jgi:hypothetical protein